MKRYTVHSKNIRHTREFLSRTIAYINSKLETDHITGPIYHPQAQGAVERMHRKINEITEPMETESEKKQNRKYIRFAHPPPTLTPHPSQG